MNRIVFCTVVLAGTGIATAQPKTPAALKLPGVGDTLAINGGVGWPGLQFLYDAPSFKDAAGKVVVHWFCAPKITGCTEDLARLVTLKERSTGLYIIAYIGGTKQQAGKLDPIRGSEGVGRGTVAFGPSATRLFKSLDVTGPISLVVDVDNKVQLVTAGSGVSDLDARDARINALIAGIKLHTAVATNPKSVKPNEKFELAFTIKLASWLVFSKQTANYEWKAFVPKAVTCDNTALAGGQLKPSGQTLVVKMTCRGPRGVYEGSGQLQFGYDTPSGAAGLGADGTKWKFQIMP